MARPPTKGPGTPPVVRGPQPGDHLIRFVEPVGIRSGKWRGTPKEWTVQFRMTDGKMLYVSLASEAALARLAGFATNAMERAGLAVPSVEEPYDPDEDMPDEDSLGSNPIRAHE
jgi:hypothetical protein